VINLTETSNYLKSPQNHQKNAKKLENITTHYQKLSGDFTKPHKLQKSSIKLTIAKKKLKTVLKEPQNMMNKIPQKLLKSQKLHKSYKQFQKG
jgi:hypothetical protein